MAARGVGAPHGRLGSAASGPRDRHLPRAAGKPRTIVAYNLFSNPLHYQSVALISLDQPRVGTAADTANVIPEATASQRFCTDILSAGLPHMTLRCGRS